MRRITKITLLALAAAVFLAVGVAVYLAATFDPNDYVPRLAELVRDKTGRTLTVTGKVKLSFWPDVAVQLGPLALSERDGTTSFADVESARLRLEMTPLMSRQFVADEIDLRGARVRIVRDAQGRLNVDDLLGREGPRTEFDVGRVRIADSTLSYEDLGSGARYTVSALSAETGRLANRVPTTVALAFTAVDAHAPWQFAVTFKSGMVFDLDAHTVTLDRTALDARGRSGEDALDVNLLAASLAAAPESATAEMLVASLHASGPAGTTEAKVTAPRVVRNGDTYGAEAVAVDVKLARGETTFEAAIGAAVERRAGSPEIAFSALQANFSTEGPRLPGRRITGSANGSATVDAHKEGVHVRLAGKIGDSNVTAEISTAGFAAPVYTFKLDVDKLDLARYATTGKTAPADSTGNLLQPLADVPASGTLRIGALKSGELNARNVTLVLR